MSTSSKYLRRLQTLSTSGARAVQPVEVDGLHLLAIPQLAYDVPGTPAHMNGGDSETDVLLLRRDGDRFEPWGTLPAPGGEDAEFFTIGERSFLAVASIRTGAGPYDFHVPSTLFEWDGARFAPFQLLDTFAAKQCRHFRIADRHFLAVAQGLPVPGEEAHHRSSAIYAWDGRTFVRFQDVPSRAGYNWHAFTVGGTAMLAHADHLAPSVLYRWDGRQFTAHQELAEAAGRAFTTFEDPLGADTYLVVACIQHASRVLRWDETSGYFVEHQRLAGAGARELTVIRTPRGLYMVRVNFIHGTPADPTAALMSQIYQWRRGRLEVVDEFPTSGGTDLTVLDSPDGPLLVQTNALAPDLRFATHSHVYRFLG
ncbi:hypothetical protein [Streptomyces sp. NPDC048641]|uniref:hypothetical protein n=1 Tax=Streptomyces sp. NPDC048641 TaxID=3154825 RepID=UPI0034393EC1